MVDVSMDEDSSDESVQDFSSIVLVFFDDMLDSNQKQLGLLLVKEAIMIWRFFDYHSHTLIIWKK